jgi:ABC-2 type transport system permease protein
MKFLIAAWYEFLKNIRDVKMLAFLVVFPIVVAYLIGSAVSGYFTPDDGKPMIVAYVNLDDGAVGRALDGFLDAEEVKERIDIRPYASLEEGRKALSDGSCTALVHLPEGLSENVLLGSGGKIELEGGEGLEYVNALAGSFASSFNAHLASMQAGGGLMQTERVDAVTRVSRTKGGAFPSMIGYYSVLVLLQALVIGAIFGAYITARNYGSDIHIRIHALPVKPWSLLFGRITGSVAYLLMASAATILFTKFVYGVDWGGNVPIMAGALALFSFTVVSIGVICGRVFKKISTSVMIVFLLMFFFGTVSGSISPKNGAVALGFLTPNYYAKELLFGTIYGYPDQTMIKSALILAAFAAAAGLAVMALTRRAGNDNI